MTQTDLFAWSREHEALYALISLATQEIDAFGRDESKLTLVDLVIKRPDKPTGILLASETHYEERYRPGSKHITWIMEANGLKNETYGAESSDITPSSVILKNIDPLRYPDGHSLAGQIVMGKYQGEIFIPDPNGTEMLYNEWISDLQYVKDIYGVDATLEWQKEFKKVPTFVLQIPYFFGEINLVTAKEKRFSLSGGSYVGLQPKSASDNTLVDIYPIQEEQFDTTYMPFSDFLREYLFNADKLKVEK